MKKLAFFFIIGLFAVSGCAEEKSAGKEFPAPEETPGVELSTELPEEDQKAIVDKIAVIMGTELPEIAKSHDMGALPEYTAKGTATLADALKVEYGTESGVILSFACDLETNAVKEVKVEKKKGAEEEYLASVKLVSYLSEFSFTEADIQEIEKLVPEQKYQMNIEDYAVSWVEFPEGVFQIYKYK